MTHRNTQDWITVRLHLSHTLTHRDGRRDEEVDYASVSVACGVPVVVLHVHEFIYDVQEVRAVFLQQTLIERPISEAHLHQDGHHGILSSRFFRKLWRNEAWSLTNRDVYNSTDFTQINTKCVQ